MPREPLAAAKSIVTWLAVLVVVKTTAAVVLNYGSYFPPEFGSGFLLGRSAYFWTGYHLAFYAHIVSGPFCLLSGLVLMNAGAGRRWPAWHRRIGRWHGVAVLLLLAPSGLAMAFYAPDGTVAVAGFAALSLATGLAAAAGWRAAVRCRFDQHRRWMQRCFALLLSAVVLRIIGGATLVLGIDGAYPLTAWASWLLPLAALELARLKSRVRSRWSLRRPRSLTSR